MDKKMINWIIIIILIVMAVLMFFIATEVSNISNTVEENMAGGAIRPSSPGGSSIGEKSGETTG